MTLAPRPALGLTALLLAGTLAACGGSDSGDAAAQTYDSSLEAPERSAYDGTDDVSPTPDDGRAELDLDSGAQVVIWIDPDQIADVYEQHSDPDAEADDDTRWTEPNLLYSAGDGCLSIDADTDGTLVAATLGCYETDAFEQQAPDQGQAVVTTDLADWQVEDGGELYEPPQISGDGETVSWPGGPTWTADGGFE